MKICQLLKLFPLVIGLGLAEAAYAQNSDPIINPCVPWPATDGLGRQLPMSDEVGLPKNGRFVGLFYFLWLGRHGEEGPFDNSVILQKDPTAITNAASPLWGPMGAPHHWGESIFGYYVSEDPGVLRKHAQMLADAGVDVIIFDISNQFTYPESWRPLCRVFEQIRQEGGRTPQIAFLCPFWGPRKAVKELWEQLYSKGLYSDLWFQWKGKPLILADPTLLGGSARFGSHKNAVRLESGHKLGQAFVTDKEFAAVGGEMPTWNSKSSGVTLTLFREGPGGEQVLSQRFDEVSDNAWVMLTVAKPLEPGRYYLEASLPQGTVGWWGDSGNTIPGGQAFADGKIVAGQRTLKIAVADETSSAILRSFTFRKPQPDYFVGPTGPDQWSWLEVSPQHVFTNALGLREQMSVGVAQNAVDGKLGVLSNPRSMGRSFHNGMEPEPQGRDVFGRNFQDQWQRALDMGPEFIFVTGWNEWVAGRADSSAPFQGAGPVAFVDEFNAEFSRDIEPMKGGHGDAYYHQMIANIRRYKGVAAIPLVKPGPINVDGRFEDWASVSPEFLDGAGDSVKRDSRGWARESRYVNRTGRNDITAAKASMDATNLYFYVKTLKPLTQSSDTNWMLLFIDADGDSKTGWLGYDFVVNRINVRSGTTTLEHNAGGYRWGAPVGVSICFKNNEMELAIPRVALGLTNLPATVDFKWADNIQLTGEADDFTLNGDCAPNDRYNFRARFE